MFHCQISMNDWLGSSANVATIDDKILKFRRQFRFDKRWIGEEGLMESIERGWSVQRGGTTADIRYLFGGKVTRCMESEK